MRNMYLYRNVKGFQIEIVFLKKKGISELSVNIFYSKQNGRQGMNVCSYKFCPLSFVINFLA